MFLARLCSSFSASRERAHLVAMPEVERLNVEIPGPIELDLPEPPTERVPVDEWIPWIPWDYADADENVAPLGTTLN